MHWNDIFRFEKSCRIGRLSRIHGKAASNGKEGKFGLIDLAEDLHISKNSCIAYVIEGEAILKSDDESCRISCINVLIPLGDAGSVKCMNHRDGNAMGD